MLYFPLLREFKLIEVVPFYLLTQQAANEVS